MNKLATLLLVHTVWVPLFGISCFFAGFLSHKYFHIHFDIPLVENRLASKYQFINPLLECDEVEISRDTNLTGLRREISSQIDREIASKNIASAAVYYRDMNNGPWFGINENTKFSPASLIKVPLMIAVLKRTASDPKFLDQELTLPSTDYSKQNIKPEVTLVPGQKYKISELLNNMIVYSDDAAFDVLNSQFTAQEMLQVYNDLGVDISQALQNPNGDIISVKDYASFFRILYNGTYLSLENSEYALELLSRVKYRQGLTAPVPTGIKVAHKFGERQFLPSGTKQLHDCGIVYLPDKQYLICVMTRGEDFDKMSRFIAGVSKTTFDSLSR